MLKRLLAPLSLGALGMLLWSAPAQAQEPDVLIGQTGIITNFWQPEGGYFPDTGWQVRDTECDPYPECDRTDAVESTITGPSAVDLTKVASGTGTSIETSNLNLTVETDTTLTVEYDLGSDADTVAGAIRLFWYNHPDGDTIKEAPTAFVAAKNGSGTLSLNIPAYATIGTMGLTYDASNDSTGTVTFSDLTVDGTLVLFQEPESEPEPTSSPSPSPTATATIEPTPSPATSPSTEPVAEEKSQLPQTGNGLFYLIAIGLILLAAGTAAFGLSKLRARQ